MGNCLNSTRSEKDSSNHGRTGLDTAAEGPSQRKEELIGAEEIPGPELVTTGANSSQTADEMVRRINDELAEFRQQLKKSQELLHSMQANGSASAATLSEVTQSCPLLLTKPELLPVAKPTLVCCSTQTDTVIEQPRRLSSTTQPEVPPVRSLLDAIEDSDNDNEIDPMFADKLSDDFSYKLTINLPTVLEESEEHETDTPRRLSQEDRSRKKSLVKMSTIASEVGSESSSNKCEDESEGMKSDTGDYRSAVSSLPGSVCTSTYNSLERPLQIKGNGGAMRNGDFSDATSIISDGTFGSPISSPSSPTYWTPLEGSSSQETITNTHDGDKTPINEVNGYDRLEVLSCPVSSNRREYENGYLRQRGSSWGSSMPMYKDTKSKFRKTEGLTVEYNLLNSTSVPDFDDLSDENIERFPDLVETFFKQLDSKKDYQTLQSLSEEELEEISKRFNHLALVFHTEHKNLIERKDVKLKQYDHSKLKMRDSVQYLADTLSKLEEICNSQSIPGLNSLSAALNLLPADLTVYAENLSKSSRRIGMMDVQLQLYKMIEVMVLYVKILRNLYVNKEKEYFSAKNLLEKNNIAFPNGSLASTSSCHNNNNHDNHQKVNENDFPIFEIGEYDDFFGGNELCTICHVLENSREKSLSSSRNLNKTTPKAKFYLCKIISLEAHHYLLPLTWVWVRTREIISTFLIIMGLAVILKCFFPTVSAKDSAPVPDLASIVSKHGDLTHGTIPPI